MGYSRPHPAPRMSCLPGWWFTSYIIIFVLFAATAVTLILCGVNALIAVGAPATLSVAAVAAMRALTASAPGLGVRHDHALPRG
ncbi:hypothetical protein [Nocardia tengchongensis]|uniref:hypothetical protein n=1 Tax=Nocardia tengchongensis TaxID=2055889 RepID=UPI00369B7C64